jgi:EpsI family protein
MGQAFRGARGLNLNSQIRLGIILVMLVGANFAQSGFFRSNAMPLRRDLGQFPMKVGDWIGLGLPPLTAREQEVLKADDYLWRAYSGEGVQAGLFVVYYESQRSGDAIHSPKNCLPGAGWEPVYSETLRIQRPGQSDKSFAANHYRVAKNGQEQDILYWYQANERTFSSEYMGKFYLVYDALTKHRTDGAMIRISVMHTGKDDHALQAAKDFASQLSAVLPDFLPQ